MVHKMHSSKYGALFSNVWHFFWFIASSTTKCKSIIKKKNIYRSHENESLTSIQCGFPDYFRWGKNVGVKTNWFLFCCLLSTWNAIRVLCVCFLWASAISAHSYRVWNWMVYLKVWEKKKNLVGAKTQILTSLTHFSPPLMLPSYKEEEDASWFILMWETKNLECSKRNKGKSSTQSVLGFCLGRVFHFSAFCIRTRTRFILKGNLVFNLKEH